MELLCIKFFQCLLLGLFSDCSITHSPIIHNFILLWIFLCQPQLCTQTCTYYDSYEKRQRNLNVGTQDRDGDFSRMELHNSKEVICRQSWSIYLCQSSSWHFLSLHYTFSNIISPSILSPSCLIIYLPLLSTCHSSTLFSRCPFSLSLFSLFYLSTCLFSQPSHSLCRSPSHGLPFLLSNQVVSVQPSPLIKGVL